MLKNKKILILAAVLVLGLVGAYMTGMVPGKADPNANKRYVVPPVDMAEPFTVNTNDPDGNSYLELTLALQLAPMKADEWSNYSSTGKKAAAGAEMPGAAKVSTYPKFRDAVNETAAMFSAKELRTDAGKAKFKQALLTAFEKIYQVDEAEAKAAPQNSANLGVEPPYKVSAVYLSNFAVQVNS